MAKSPAVEKVKRVFNLEEIYLPVRKELLLTESEIFRQVNNTSFATKELLRYFLRKKGKFIRPALVLLSAKSVSEEPAPHTQKQLVSFAVAMEFIHSASLIHDDIIDDEIIRRGQISLNKQFSNQVAVLTGDVLYSRAFAIISERFDVKIISLLSECVEGMCDGEIEELLKPSNSYTEYLKLTHKKTANLMSVCCYAGALIAKAGNRLAKSLGSFGLNFGIAYQIMDDYLDNSIPAGLNVNIILEAKKYVKRAEKNLKILGNSICKKSLENLSEYIISPVGTLNQAHR
ncbi:MAG: polyprenyl synthetase family protein, partial [Elusimicrobiota bacterium]